MKPAEETYYLHLTRAFCNADFKYVFLLLIFQEQLIMAGSYLQSLNLTRLLIHFLKLTSPINYLMLSTTNFWKPFLEYVVTSRLPCVIHLTCALLNLTYLYLACLIIVIVFWSTIFNIYYSYTHTVHCIHYITTVLYAVVWIFWFDSVLHFLFLSPAQCSNWWPLAGAASS